MTAPIRNYRKRAQFYDIEYPETRDHEFLTNTIRNSNETVLILPGGTGTTALALHKAYPECRIVSVDIEPEMVAICGENFERRSPANLTSRKGDMTNLVSEVKFDHIFVAREAFQMLPDDVSASACLKSLKRNLKSGGEIILDVANFDVEDCASDLNYFEGSRVSGKSYLDWKRAFGDTRLLRHTTQIIDTSGDRQFHFSYEIEKSGQCEPESFDATVALRKYTQSHLERLFDDAELTIKAKYGDYDKRPLGKNAPRLCYVLV